MVSFASVGKAAPFALPNPLHFGPGFPVAAISGFCPMSFVSAVAALPHIPPVSTGRRWPGLIATWSEP